MPVCFFSSENLKPPLIDTTVKQIEMMRTKTPTHLALCSQVSQSVGFGRDLCVFRSCILKCYCVFWLIGFWKAIKTIGA